MKHTFYKLYVNIFARGRFRELNTFFFEIGLRGLGILNYTGSQSGEEYMLKKVLPLVGQKPIVFDVGANLGDYTETVLEISSNAQVYAFEPHPKNYSKLKSKIKNIVSINSAVGQDDASEISLYDYPADLDGSQHASVYQNCITDVHGSKEVTEYKVKCISLDTFCNQNNIEYIDLLKIDTEGHEFSVLKGASNLLHDNKIKFIHFEFNAMNVQSRTFMKDFYDMLSTRYKMYRLLPKGFLEIFYFHSVDNEIFAYQNIIAVNKDIDLLASK